MTRNPNRMAEAVERLAARFASHASVKINYLRGPVVVNGLDATVGRTPFEVIDGGVLTVFECRDYIVSAAAMVNPDTGEAVLPASGALITEVATGRRYSVAAPEGENVYESIGPAGTVLKIHTKAYDG